VACCSSLQGLRLHNLPDSFTSALTRLSGLTSVRLFRVTDQQCSSLAQLTGLRELVLSYAWEVSTVGLRQLAALEQLTSLGIMQYCDTNKVGPAFKKQMSDQPTIISKVGSEGLSWEV